MSEDILNELSENIELTKRAAKRIEAILKAEDKLDHGLRVEVISGGCSGMNYNMTFDNKIILITGGSGFIGSNFLKYFLNFDNIKIINFDLIEQNIKNEKITFIKGNLTNKNDLNKLNL